MRGHLNTVGELRLPRFSSAVRQNGCITLQWRRNEHAGVSNHQPHNCLLNRFIRAQIKENIKAPPRWPLWVEFTDDRWILHTKGQ